MTIEGKLKAIKKLEQKKKWEDASKELVDVAEYYIEKKEVVQSLQYYERAISAQQKEKKAEKIIVLYRKIISAARKGKTKTRKELFRYAAAAIPLIEEYIQVLKESNRYVSKHGAMTRYFLGECREIVSGVTQRNEEFVRAGHIFVDVGKKLFSSQKTRNEAEESFEKARIIFDLMKNRDETFKAFLEEAEMNIQNFSLERGFILFEEARGLFDDDSHLASVVDIEKDIYAEKGLELLHKHFNDPEKRNTAEMLISKSREAHLLAKSLDQVSGILFEIGKISIKNKELESGFNSFDEAITNSQLVGDEAIPRQIVEYLFHEGKAKAEKLFNKDKLDTSEIESLPAMIYFNKIEEIGKKLEMGHEIEEVATYIWQLGKDLQAKRIINSDFPFIDKSLTILIRNNRHGGFSKIVDELEKRLDIFAENRKIEEFVWLKTFLVESYRQIDDNQSAGWLNVKIAKQYLKWGNFEEQIACLHQSSYLFQNTDQNNLRAFCESLDEQFNELERMSVPESIRDEMINLRANTYLQLQDIDKYDSLFTQLALNSLETNDFSKAMEFHQNDFDFLVRTKNIPRALARVQEFSNIMLSKGQHQLISNLLSKQTNLLIGTNASQDQVIQSIKNLEDKIIDALSQKADITLIDEFFTNIIKLYDYLGLKEAKGDATYEMASRFFENEYEDEGFRYLKRSYELFKAENVVEKYGLLLDFAFEKKNYYMDLADYENADRFLEFLISTLMDLNQIKEAAELIMSRAVNLVPIDEDRAYGHFEQAKKLILQTETADELLQFSQDYGSALLQAGKIEKGMEILAQAEGSTSANSLAIADTCLTVAENRFKEQDYDTYFVLVDRALSIYTELEMIQESSSIALAEARKLWSVDNLPYTMIYLERAWAPLSMSYVENLNQSIQPILQASDEFISSLFDKEMFDEAKNFLEFQERIYKHLNLTDKVLEVEKRKIHALIGRGNIDGALSQVYDIASWGIEESKFTETISLLQELLPNFIVRAPTNTKDLLKIFISLLVTMKPQEKARKILLESLDHYITLLIESASQQQNLFENQSALFFSALAEVAEAEDLLMYFTINFCKEMTKRRNYLELFSVLQQSLPNLYTIKPEVKIGIVNEISSILEHHETDDALIFDGLDFLNNLTQNIDSQNREIVSRIFVMIARKYQSQSKIYNYAIQLALEHYKQTPNVSATLDLLYELIETDLKTKNYLNSLRRLDEAIERLENAPIVKVKRFEELLSKYLAKLSSQKEKKWQDLITNKHQLIRERFLSE
ncbi:MAG: hypothetical protein JSV04_06625 [Candidatus Heimdallarchaeota archaeon]|nr:MAG: hypothetical protein JSV04_06625 [Candidatus Heimdallarchaeota archaeon]